MDVLTSAGYTFSPHFVEGGLETRQSL